MNAERILAEFLELGGQVELAGPNLNLRAPKGAITEVLREKLKACKAELCAIIGPGRKFAPISSQEQRLWYLHTQESAGNAYNMDAAFRIDGPLDTAALNTALTVIAQRHEPLRTAYVTLDGKPYRAVAAEAAFTVSFLDVSNEPEKTAEQKARQLGETFSHAAFDLSVPLLIRAHIVRVSLRIHYLFIVVHHIAADGGSIQILIRELAESYRALTTGTHSALPAIPMSYSECLAQQIVTQKQTLAQQLAYWAKALDGGISPPELPLDRRQSTDAAHPGCRRTADLPQEVYDRLREWARIREASVFSVLLAAFAALLRRYATQDSIPIGIISTLRKHPHAEPLMGFFANTLPIRADFSGDPSFETLVSQVHRKVREAEENGDAPFEKIVSAARLRRSSGALPLVHTLFSMLKLEQMTFDAPNGVRFQRIPMQRGNAKAPLAAVIIAHEDGLRAAFEYDTALFEDRTAAIMLQHYLRILEQSLRHPETPTSCLDLLTPNERNQILYRWNDTVRPYPNGMPIHLCVEQHAAHRPEAPAIVHENRTVSYRQMEANAEHWARLLMDRKSDPPLVGVCLPRSPEMAIAQCAAWKAGRAYIALDPGMPLARLAGMLHDADCRTVFTVPHESERFAAAGFHVLPVHLDATLPTFPKTAAHANCENINPLAYVIFTSGSTGRPKGVQIDHASLLNLCSWFTERFSITPADRMSCLFNPSFDALASEIWPCLMSGATLFIPSEEIRTSPEKLRGWLIDARITLCSLPTVLAEQLVAMPWPENVSLRCLITGGDRLRRHPPRPLPFAFVNVYGPTENTIISTCYELPAGVVSEDPPPIGHPIANTQVYILDAHGQPAPPLATGEICLGGSQVARGYLHQPELTAERFSGNPFAQGRLYRTGDLGRFRPNGVIEFIGRCDTQIQLRGLRIETEEIERRLCQITGVAEAAVIMNHNAKGGARLVAYMVCAPRVDASGLRQALAETLPEYMIPNRFVALERMPLNENGKLDRKRLTDDPPKGRMLELERTGSPMPRNPVEVQLIAIWTELLDTPGMGIYDDFFALGGDSLLATQAISRIQRCFAVELPLSSFFAEPNIAAIAAKIAELAHTQPPRPPDAPVAVRPHHAPAHAAHIETIDALSEEQLARTLQELG